MKSLAIAAVLTLSLAAPVLGQETTATETMEQTLCVTVAGPTAVFASDSTLRVALWDGTARVVEIAGSEACAQAEVATEDGALQEVGQDYDAWAAHQQRTVRGLTAQMRHVIRDGRRGSISQVRGAFDQFGRFVSAEQRYLRSHPPQACYASEWETWRSGIDRVASGVALSSRSTRVFDIGMLKQGTRQVMQGMKQVREAVGTMSDCPATGPDAPTAAAGSDPAAMPVGS